MGMKAQLIIKAKYIQFGDWDNNKTKPMMDTPNASVPPTTFQIVGIFGGIFIDPTAFSISKKTEIEKNGWRIKKRYSSNGTKPIVMPKTFSLS